MKKNTGKDNSPVTMEYGEALAVRMPGVLDMVLCYPNTYSVGMASLGFQTVWKLTAQSKWANVERCFYGAAAAARSLESGSNLKSFDIAAFSVSFELDYINLIKMLMYGGMEPLACDRKATDPLIIGGGAFTFFNPEVLAPVLDIIFVGEAEDGFTQLLGTIYQLRCADKTKDEILMALSTVPSLYIPSLMGNGKQMVPVAKAVLNEFTSEDIACSFRLSPESEFPDTFLLEIARGCGRHCRYCMAGYCYRKPRFHSFTSLKPVLDKAMQLADKIGLVGAAVSDHPDIDAIVNYIRGCKKNLSVSSLRAETADAELFRALAQSGQKTVTFAPETGSLHLRQMINKDITDELLFEKIRLACECGLLNVRYYLMIGLPTETENDIQENIDFILRADAVLKQASSGRGRSTLSVGIFVPKPWTPFERVAMLDPKEADTRLEKIKKVLGSKGIRVNSESSGWAWVQGILARGSRRTGVKLVSLVQEDILSASRLKKAFADEPRDYLNISHEQMPWSSIDNGVDVSYLELEYEKALAGELTSPCMGIDCTRCGVC